MKRIIISLFIVFISTSSFTQSVESKIDNLISKYVNYNLFNGTVLVADESGIIFKKGYGYANMEWKIPNQSDVKFRLGSITKQFTAMLIMQLVESGKINLERKITDYLPYYRKDTGDRVTIHQLLTHTSGIPSYTSNPDFEKINRDRYEPDEFIKEYCMEDFEFEPGTQFAYNNSGYFILGAIIEKITGKSYGDVLKERIFEPLDMNASGYDWSEDLIENRAAGYEKNGVEFKNAAYLDMSQPFSAGSLYSTVEDLYKWDRALYTNKLLSDRYKEIYFKPYQEAMGGHYAYGWVIYKNKKLNDDKELTMITHGGGINGFNTIISRIVDDKKLVVLLNNTGTTSLSEISNSVFNILYDKSYPEPKIPVSMHLIKVIENDGISAALDEYKRIKENDAESYNLKEQELNSLGYYLLNHKKNKEAAAIFKLNIDVYPESFNVYDSMGEALLALGDSSGAIENYTKSLELNSRNTNAVDVLNKLGVKAAIKKDPVITPDILKKYEGKYKLQENFIITISTDKNKIFAQATGQPKFEIFPENDKKFYFKVVNAQIEFQLDDKGNAASLILFQNGKNMPAAKIE